MSYLRILLLGTFVIGVIFYCKPKLIRYLSYPWYWFQYQRTTASATKDRRKLATKYVKEQRPIPANEFDPSLEIDLDTITDLNPGELAEYRRNVLQQRIQAHAAEEKDFLKRRKS